MNVRARKGSGITNKQAASIAAALDKLEQQGKRGTKANLLRMAQAKSSPLHDLFEWDDKKAAHAARLARAGKLIASVEYLAPKPTKRYWSVRSVTPTRTREYRRHEVVMLDKNDERSQLSVDDYRIILAAVNRQSSLNNDRDDPAWRKIVLCIRSNVPRAVRALGGP